MPNECKRDVRLQGFLMNLQLFLKVKAKSNALDVGMEYFWFFKSKFDLDCYASV